jgi:hypothetical protein
MPCPNAMLGAKLSIIRAHSFRTARHLAGAFDVAVGEFVFAALDNFVAM